MLPTLKQGQTVKYQYESALSYGDIVLVKVNGKHIVKRVIGLSGDEVSLDDGILYRNGGETREDYALLDNSTFGPIIVPAEHIFVLGDNRAHSKDSRHVGCIHIDSYIGTIILSE